MLGISIWYWVAAFWDLLNCLYFANTTERGDRGWKEAQRLVTFQITLMSTSNISCIFQNMFQNIITKIILQEFWHYMAFQSLFMSLFKLRTFRTGKKEQHRREELTQRKNKKMKRLNNSLRTSVHVDIPQLHNWTYYFHHKICTISWVLPCDKHEMVTVEHVYHILDTQHKMSLQRFSTCDMNILNK